MPPTRKIISDEESKVGQALPTSIGSLCGDLEEHVVLDVSTSRSCIFQQPVLNGPNGPVRSHCGVGPTASDTLAEACAGGEEGN